MVDKFSSRRINMVLANFKLIKYSYFFVSGLLLTASFAPFHYSIMAFLSLALLFYGISYNHTTPSFLIGFIYGLGFFSTSVSWVYVSIYNYGHLPCIISLFITFLFIAYLSLFPAALTYIFQRFNKTKLSIWSCLIFSALWVISESIRGSLFTGFPWVTTGYGQIDSNFRWLLPIIGVYGVSFYTALISSVGVIILASKAYRYLSIFLILIIVPFGLDKTWTVQRNSAISVGIVQANLSMRDKWDETFFWKLLERYSEGINQLMPLDLIVLPESAIPLPRSFISDFYDDLNKRSGELNTAILMGMPELVKKHSEVYFNSLVSVGAAKGVYHKQHLVPFGEYIPSNFAWIMQNLGLPEANLQPDNLKQMMIMVKNHPVATLICYELAYGDLLRHQLPEAEWIVSISDAGWFGHSLAVYQQLQMAQVRSLETGRFGVVANNDGLSSIINANGNIVASLPIFVEGLLKSHIFPSYGKTPWIIFGDWPIIIFSLLIILLSIVFQYDIKKELVKAIAASRKRRYPYQPQ